MAVLVQDLTSTATLGDRAWGGSRGGMGTGGIRADVIRTLREAEPLWRELEAAPGAVMTPYQRFDWVAAFVEAEVGAEAARQAECLRILVLRDPAGKALALLPLRLTRAGGITVARVIGSKHANFHMPLYASRQASLAEPERIAAALRQAGRAAGIDAFALDHQPRFWDGAANPVAGLTGGGVLGTRLRPCASDAYGLMLGPDPETTLKRAFSGDARKKLRAKERKLVEAVGAVEHRVADTPEAVAAILPAFYAQKSLRFRAMGLPDPYAPPQVRRFVEAATGRRGGSGPAVAVHALVVAQTGRVLATFGGAVDATRFSGMWTSFDTDPDLARFSLGDLLLHRLIAHETAAGRRSLDLGVGEARYKSSICDETVELVEVLIPVTLRGHLYAALAGAGGEAKRRIKRSPRLWRAVRALRRLDPRRLGRR